MQGAVSLFNRVRGYGFVVPDDPTWPPLFFHRSQIAVRDGIQFLMPGDIIEFEIGEHGGRKVAISIKKIEPVTGGAR